MTRVVLASASDGRRRVLRGAGIDPLVLVSGVDEEALVSALPDDATPSQVTTTLATAKARAVTARLDPVLAADCVVIACDSMLYHRGQLRGKPISEAMVVDGWQAMAGTSGELYTGHCVIRLDQGEQHELSAASAATIHFGTPSVDDLAAYAASGEPVSVAGGFTLDGRGGWFVERVEGDPSTVIGIGLPLLRQMLHELGLSIAHLWHANPP